MSKPIIVAVDDSPSVRESIAHTLKASGLDVELRLAEDGAAALPMALAPDTTLVLSDVVMPGLDGLKLLRTIRQQRSAEELPVILLTSESDSDIRSEAFVAGASDYIAKPFTDNELMTRVHVHLRLLYLQDEVRRLADRSQTQGTFDELTGMANRRGFVEVCARELARCRRYKFEMTVGVLELDGFGALQAKLGELVSDAILAEVGQVIQDGLRRVDMAARLCTDRFAVLLPQTAGEHADVVAQRLCDSMAEHLFPGTQPSEMTASIGTASYPSSGLESVDDLLVAAQSVLQAIQSSGGNEARRYAIG